ncbi:MAG: hypothetical protein OXF49_01490 [Candidatus Saccharibacteria bacterium]|nr:hypothetical protein [Candidatus Saccharibacteria bacterium]
MMKIATKSQWIKASQQLINHTKDLVNTGQLQDEEMHVNYELLSVSKLLLKDTQLGKYVNVNRWYLSYKSTYQDFYKTGLGSNINNQTAPAHLGIKLSLEELQNCIDLFYAHRYNTKQKTSLRWQNRLNEVKKNDDD